MALVNPVQQPGSLCYLKYSPRFEHEKPFFIRFPLDDFPEAEQTNLEFDYYDVSIEDIRDTPHAFTLDHHGFELDGFRTKLKYEDFNDFRETSKAYFRRD